MYYANYLKFMERGRTEMTRQLGLCHSSSFNEGKCFFVVRGVNIEYLQPAYLDDELTIYTQLDAIGSVRMEITQSVMRGEVTLAQAQVNLVNVDQKRKPARIPAEFRNLMIHYLKEK